MTHTGGALGALGEPGVRLEAGGVVVDEEVVLVGRGPRLGEDVHEGPAREGEVDGSRGEALDGS